MKIVSVEAAEPQFHPYEWGGSGDLTARFASSSGTRALLSRAMELRNAPSPSMLISSSIAEKSLEERLYDALAAAKVYTSKVAMHMDTEWRSKLFRQLDSLLDVEEWLEEDAPLQEASFATFLKMMFLLKPKKRPGLGLSSQGLLIAAWTEDDRRLTIECLPNDMTQWVASQVIGRNVERTAGIARIERLPAVLQPFEIDRWLRRGQEG